MKDLNTYYLTDSNYVAEIDQNRNTCTVYFNDGDYANDFYFDDIKTVKKEIAEFDDGWFGEVTKKLGEYDSIEHCVAVNFPEHTMPKVEDIFKEDNSRMFFLTNDKSIVELYHTTDGDEAHPYFNGSIPGIHLHHNENLCDSLSVKTTDEIRRRLSEQLYDKMQVEDKIAIRAIDRKPIPDGKLISFPGAFEGIYLKYTDDEFEKLGKNDLFGYDHFYGRIDLKLKDTLKFCEANDIKIDDIIAYKELGDGLVILEECKLNELFNESLSTLSENEKEAYFNEAVQLGAAYDRDEILLYSVYDTKGDIEFSEYDYNGKAFAQNTIDDAKCYLGQYDTIDDCMDDWRDTFKREAVKEREQNKDKDDELVR